MFSTQVERLINEGKISQDYIAPIGVNLRQKDHSPVITFNGGDDKLVMNMPDGQFSLHDNAIGRLFIGLKNFSIEKSMFSTR